MNALVKKEIRLLLPNFLFAGVLALAGLFYTDHVNGMFSGIIYFGTCVFFPATVVMLGLSPFGGEVGAGTFANLLAQPVPRLKIWETKIALLALALFALAILWGTTFLIGTALHGGDHDIKDWLDLFSIVITFGLVIFSGGLWTVLLLRQVAAAFWFTLLVPGAILTVLAALFSEHDGNFFQGVVVTVLGLYSLAGFFFARRLFLRAQDLQWSGGSIVMPEMRGLKRFQATGERRQWRPRAALWRKEFMLHQSQFVVAFVLLVLHLGVLAVRNFCDLSNSIEIKFMLEIFWGLWLALPLLVGCAAVAEERKIGTHDAQLCLPANRRTQFCIKLAVALGLALLFGVAIPLLLEGNRILPNLHWQLPAMARGWESTLSPVQINVVRVIEILRVATPLLSFVFISLVVCLVSFYVSTLARNTLQTLAPAVVGIMAAWMLVFFSFAPWSNDRDFFWNEFLWCGPIGFLVGLPVIALIMFRRAFANFEQLRPDWRLIARNAAVFIFALELGIVSASAVYHRLWEKFSKFEPAHGAARLTLANPAILELPVGEFFVRLPDGRMWRSWWEPSPERNNPVSRLLGNFPAVIAPGKFFSGTNWLAVQRARSEIIGLKNNGTLWVSEIPLFDERQTNGPWKFNQNAMDRMVQVGTDTDWNSLALEAGTYTLLTKSDGTLWLWGDIKFDGKKQAWPGLRAFTPRRFGTESNWAGISRGNLQTTFYKTDGSGWIMSNWETNGLPVITIEDEFVVHSAPALRRGAFSSRVNIQHWMNYLGGIAADGTFRIYQEQHYVPRAHKSYGDYVAVPADYQIGSGSNWLVAAGGWVKTVTLKNDGTLWLWDFRPRGLSSWTAQADGKTFAPEIQRTVPVQLGSHTDWIAVAGNEAEVVALAADGSLWFWPLESPARYYNSGNNDSERIPQLLDISRKPQRLGNVFETR